MTSTIPRIYLYGLLLTSLITFGSARAEQIDIVSSRFTNVGQYQALLPGSLPLQQIMGVVPPAVRDARKLKTVETDKVLSLTIALKLNEEDELEELLQDLYDPNSSKYHQFLTQDQFANRFSPTLEQVASVKKFMESNGMEVESVDPNRLLIQVKGRVETINRVFHTQLWYYSSENLENLLFHAPAYELQIEENLPIQGVYGLDDALRAHHHSVRRAIGADGDIEATGTGPNKGFAPSDIRTAYSIPSNLTGSGQTLGLLELAGYKASDITAYENYFKLPKVTLQNVFIDGATGSTTDDEVTLDIELMAAVAPGAQKILVYIGKNTGKSFINILNKMATDNIAKSISCSWGSAETTMSSSSAQTENNIFRQMAAQGQAFYSAAGDDGAYDDSKTLSVDDPGSQPYVVSVGGTRLKTNSNGTYASETTWNKNNTANGGAGGGGISKFWTIPTWQQGVISSSSKGSTKMRNVPDVSLNADPNTGYSIYADGSWTIYGGTSCSAPLWAAYSALVNQQRASKNLSPLGFPNPSLYQIGKSSSYNTDFHDIKDGSTNIYYPAVTGYDDATGWGSFIGSSLVQDLSLK